MKNYFSLFVIVWETYELVKNEIISSKVIVKYVGFVSIIIIFIKICFSFALSFGLLEVEKVVNFYKICLNCDLTTMYFPIGNFMFYRLMVSNDYIPFVFFSFYLYDKNKITNKIFMIVVMSIYTFIIFSRIIIVQFIIILVVSLYCYFMENKDAFEKYKIKLLALCSFGFIMLLFLTFKTNLIGALIFRFSGNSTTISDSIRIEQKNELFNGINKSIFVGHGTGSYIKDYIRSETTPYTYELEYLSFLFQFGILGSLLIIVPTIYEFFDICLKKTITKQMKLLVLINLLLWVIKPLFNPGFISSNSGIIVALIYVLTDYNSKKRYFEEVIK